MERTLFPLIVDTIKRHEMIWDAMGKSDGVFDVLMKKVIHNELLYCRIVKYFELCNDVSIVN
jgi:hypothetical protein